jgi:hypothetical protein
MASESAASTSARRTRSTVTACPIHLLCTGSCQRRGALVFGMT